MSRYDSRGPKKDDDLNFSGLSSLLFAVCDVFGKNREKNVSSSLTADTSRIDGMTRQSLLFGLGTERKSRLLLLKIKNGFASLCERSILFGLLEKMIDFFLTVSAKTVASLFSAYSFTSAVIIILRYLIASGEFVRSDILLLTCCFTASIPLFFTERNLYDLLSSCFLFGGILFGREDNSVRELKEKRHSNLMGGIAFLIGIILGMGTWYLGVAYLPVAVALLFVFSLIIRFPESGLILASLISPWLGLADNPSVTLAALIGVDAIAFLLKFLRGKRTFRVSSEMIPFALLLVSVFASGFSPYNYSFRTGLLVCVLMLGYILAVNLLRNDSTIRRMALAIVISSAAVSALGIIQYIIGIAPSGWLDLSLFSAIPARTVSVFENPNVLGAYLIAVFPFSLYLVNDRTSSFRLFGCFAVLLNLVCALFTWSRLCWLGILCGTFIFLWLMTPRAVLLLPVTAAGAAGLGVIFPDTIGTRLLNFFSLNDSANSYRLRVWKGSAAAFVKNILTGAGTGDPAFRAAFLECALPGTEAAVHSHSVYLQLGIAGGIIPLLAFLVFFAFLLKKCMSRACRNGSVLNVVAYAAFASLSAMMISGIFDNVFYNYRVMYLFFLIAGVLSASASTPAGAEGRQYNDPTPEAADVQVEIKW